MEIHKDYCSKCKAKGVSLVNYCKNKLKNGDILYYYHCRDCNNSRQRKWYGENSEKARANIYKNNKKHTEKVAARKLLGAATRYKKITKPEKCSSCSRKRTLQAHHHDYSKPLEVEWLCISCHAATHKL